MAEGVRTEVTYTVDCAVGRLVALFPGSTVVEAGSVLLVLGSSPTAAYLDDEGLAAAAGTMTVLCRLAVEKLTLGDTHYYIFSQSGACAPNGRRVVRSAGGP